MTRFRSVLIVLFITVFICRVTSTIVKADTPSCDCSDMYDVGSDEWQDCESKGCTGVDVPVSGNLWVLAMAGFVFAFVKFGGHTKLAGYYYSKPEKQE